MCGVYNTPCHVEHTCLQPDFSWSLFFHSATLACVLVSVFSLFWNEGLIKSKTCRRCLHTGSVILKQSTLLALMDDRCVVFEIVACFMQGEDCKLNGPYASVPFHRKVNIRLKLYLKSSIVCPRASIALKSMNVAWVFFWIMPRSNTDVADVSPSKY